MKLSFSSKAVLTVGLMAVLPVTVGSSLLQTVRAQTEPVTIEEKMSQWRATDLKEMKICDRAFATEANGSFEGNPFFDDFKGITFSTEQQSAYDALDAQAEAERGKIYQNALSIVNPTATLSFGWFGDMNLVPQDVQTAVQAALDEGPKIDQKAALDQEFAQYGEFSGAYINYVSPEQQAQIDQITEDFYAQVQGLMTPEQLPQYRENLAARLRINEVCDGWVPVSAGQDLGRVTYMTFAPMGRLVDSIPELLQ